MGDSFGWMNLFFHLASLKTAKPWSDFCQNNIFFSQNEGRWRFCGTLNTKENGLAAKLIGHDEWPSWLNRTQVSIQSWNLLTRCVWVRVCKIVSGSVCVGACVLERGSVCACACVLDLEKERIETMCRCVCVCVCVGVCVCVCEGGCWPIWGRTTPSFQARALLY